MLELSNVTLLAIDCIQPEMACRALKYSAREINFSEVLLFTSADLVCQGITIRNIDELSDLAGYSRFCLKKLFSHVSTDFIITVQADGFIINPHLWRDEFLEYDYIGAPWPASAPWCARNRVGNGGFSLRSRRFMELAALLDDDFKHEDVFITNTQYDYFITHGCRYAPVEVAMRFALEAKVPECEYDLNNCFGFHGKGDAFYHCSEGMQFKERISLLYHI
ncbi:MAG: hypothetical protein A2X83_13040 [Desulfuromonadales bacterium GWD2_54_10]|nr:MAG: hypothetical protein A2X83_13040 [Desulfuromonadales bacterium GWD2_54_10]